MSALKKHPFCAQFILLLTGVAAATATLAAETEPPASPAVTAAMQPYLDSYKLAGLIGLIADKHGRIHYRNILGYADVEAKKPMREDSVFWIASMTKMFAGASIMMLVDEGKVSLDDPVTRFIPQLANWMVVEEKDPSHVLLKALAHPVTVRHVLSHTSGLTGSSELQQVTGADSTPLKARALSSVTGPLQWQPGEKYAYGNQGMNIAARIVEIVSGMPYEEFLQKRFFDPLGMTETTFWPSEAQIARLAGAYGPNKERNGYARGGIGFLTKPYSDRIHRFPEAGGGLFSTTHDILRYGLMLANDGELDGKRYLSHAAMAELRKEQTGTTKVNYSLGYHLRNGMFGHDGAYGTDLSVNPETGMVAIFMIQCTSGDQWAARDLFLKTAAQVWALADSDPAHRLNCLETPQAWPGGVIPYDISKLDSAAQTNALKAMQRWMDTGANIRFIPRTGEVEYVNFTGRTNAGNNTSCVGFKKGVRTDINITAFWWRQQEWMPAHELGHVLGFFHEHQRWDRDLFIAIHYENIKSGRAGDYDWVAKTNWIVNSLPYDFRSIMHYRICWASRCEDQCKDGIGSSPCAVIEPRDKAFDAVIGQWSDHGISPLDGEKARQVYGTRVATRVPAGPK